MDMHHFDCQTNSLKLVKFLKRTSLVDVSLKVLSVLYANHLGQEAHLCGKLVYN